MQHRPARVDGPLPGVSRRRPRPLPDHHLDETRLGHGVAVDGADHGAAAHDGDAIAVGEDLADLVRDEHDRDAALGQAPQRREQAVDLLRRQHRRRLVEDQDPDPPVQRLQDLHLLLDARRQAAHLDVERDGKAESPRDGLHVRAPAIQAQAPGAALGAEQDVLERGEGGDQLHVLVHHADAVGKRVGWSADLHRLTVDRDRPRVGSIEPAEDIHQRRLARAVLAEQTVDLAAAQPEVHAAQRLGGAEALGHAAHVDAEGAGLADGRHRLRAR